MSIAAISVISSAVVGTAAIVMAFRNAKDQRAHEERLAREARIQARHGEAYVEVLAAVRRITLGVIRESLLMRSPGDPDPPSPLDDDTITRLDALLAAYASDHVRALVTSWYETMQPFYDAMADAKGKLPYPSLEMRETLAVVRAAETELQEAVRKDLGQADG